MQLKEFGVAYRNQELPTKHYKRRGIYVVSTEFIHFELGITEVTNVKTALERVWNELLLRKYVNQDDVMYVAEYKYEYDAFYYYVSNPRFNEVEVGVIAPSNRITL